MKKREREKRTRIDFGRCIYSRQLKTPFIHGIIHLRKLDLERRYDNLITEHLKSYSLELGPYSDI